MLKKKKCATKKGKWSAEYKVKVSVSPLKKKKKGAWGAKTKDDATCPECGKQIKTTKSLAISKFTHKCYHRGCLGKAYKGWQQYKKKRVP